jgi:hypothetical protein
MKKSLFILFILFSFCTNAQNVVIREYCPGHEKGIPNREAAHSYYDKETNKLYLTYMDQKKLYLKTYIDFIKSEEYNFDRKEDAGTFHQVSASVLQDSKKYWLFFSNPTCTALSAMYVDLNTKEIQAYPEALKAHKNEYYLASFAEQGEFYAIYAVKESSTIRVYRYNYVTNTFEYENFSFANLKVSINNKPLNLWAVINEKIDKSNPFNYERNVNTTEKVNFFDAVASIKYYHQNEHFIITINGYDHATSIIDLNIVDKKYTISKIAFDKLHEKETYEKNYTYGNNPSVDPELYEVKENSYLLETWLYTVKVSKSKLLVSVFELEGGRKIQTFSCSSTDIEIAFSNSPIITVMEKMYSSEYKYTEVKKVKSLLKVASDESVFIKAARNRQNEIEVSIGSIYYVSKGTGHGSQAAPAFDFFKLLLDPESFNRKTQKLTMPLEYDGIVAQQVELNSYGKTQALFKVKDDYYFGYFNKEAIKNPEVPSSARGVTTNSYTYKIYFRVDKLD